MAKRLDRSAEAPGDEILDVGYAELARSYNEPEEGVERRVARNRYADRSEDA